MNVSRFLIALCLEAVTGANVLTAIFSERESHACAFLQQRGMTRFDAVNFIAHGIRKSGGDGAPPAA